jgi:hypothetical protein
VFLNKQNKTTTNKQKTNKQQTKISYRAAKDATSAGGRLLASVHTSQFVGALQQHVVELELHALVDVFV